MCNNALDLAKYIVDRCSSNETPVSNLQLQRMLYLTQGFFVCNKGLAFSDNFEAWGCGPVIPSVYYYFCVAGGMPISFPKNFWKHDKNLFKDSILKERIESFVDATSRQECMNIQPVNDFEKSILMEVVSDDSAWAQIVDLKKHQKQIIPYERIGEEYDRIRRKLTRKLFS